MFKNLKLAMKIGGGFAIVLILTSVIGVISWTSMTGVTDRVEKADDANRLVKQLLETRRQEKNYIIRGGQEYIDNVHNETEAMKQQATDTKARFEQLVNRQQMDDVYKAVGDYETAFDKYVDLSVQRDAVETQMVEAGRMLIEQAEEVRQEQKAEYATLNEADAAKEVLDDKLTKADDANRIIKWALEARRQEKNYMMREDLSSKDQAYKCAEDIITLAQDMKLRFNQAYNDGQADAIIADAQAYTAAFNEYVDLWDQMKEADAEMVDAARDVQSVSEETRADQKAQMEEEISRSTIMILVGALVALLFGLIMAVVITLSIIRAMQKGVRFAEAIAGGNLTTELDVVQKDEIGALADALRKMTDSLNDVLSQVNEAVSQVSTGADQVSQASQSLSQGASEQASSLEEISSSLNEINSQSRQNAENATEANALAKTAVGNAEGGNRQMQELVTAMGKINVSSEEIKKVVKVIDDIAFQINLLALNANVEAARAGKYGKGFAVVAEEVRNLAVRSADAVKDTTNMVDETTRNVEEGARAAEGTSKQLEEIVTGSSKVADFLGEIALASKEQAQGVEQINGGVEQIDQVTQSNTASAEESASASEELASQAQQLKGLVSRFKLADSGDGRYRERAREVSKEEQRIVRVTSNKREYRERAVDGGREKTGVTVLANKDTGGPAQRPVDPKEVIKLDDEKFGKF